CSPDNMFNYEFYMGDISVQNGSSNSWYYGDLGLVSDTIIVIATTELGCNDEGKVFVEMKDPPNAFTPNGDGVNDLFLEGYDIIVFSSWGGEIFSGNTGWDGMYNGTMVVPGTYYYIHHLYNVDGSIIKTIKGSVTLIIE
ncbi:MAG: gliding motility-associated C-terminal domain-containing protein, partial [Bacteroidota bacterium]